MPPRLVEINRIVISGASLSLDSTERFRLALAEELAAVLDAESDAAAVQSSERISVYAQRDGSPTERRDAQIVARSVARALTGR
jgi:hypothetical protein